MAQEGQKQPWALSQTPQYRKEWERLPSKFRNQVARKAHELMSDPTPGGSRTPLKGYDGLCRLRAGDFRVIYAFSHEQRIVSLLTLRRRDESTYDDLDNLELQQLQRFKDSNSKVAADERIKNWEALAKEWARPRPDPAPTDLQSAVEPLLQPITESMLDALKIPKVYWAVLLEVRSAGSLLDCQAVPYDCIQKILDQIYPRPVTALPDEAIPVVAFGDLIDPAASVAAGPIDAAATTDEPEVTMAPNKGDGGKKAGKSVVRVVPPTPLVIVSSRQLVPMRPYRGNIAKGIAKDTKYTVTLDGKVRLEFTVGDAERALLTTDAHPELVEMVNTAKKKGGANQAGGGFVINEYRYVLVPTQDAGVLFAGVYTRDLEFRFEKQLISPVAPPRIKPGDIWPGPHVGIRYTLAAGATDVRYESETERGTIKQVQLSKQHDPTSLAGLLAMFRAVKPNGGAVYINEARELFAPVERHDGYKRCYIGHLGTHPWFAPPA